MQLLPIEAIDAGVIVDGETVVGAMMQTRERADVVVGPHTACHADVTADSSEVHAAVNTSRADTAAHALNVIAAAKSPGVNLAAEAAHMRVTGKVAEIGPAHVGPGTGLAEMRAAANPSHMAATAETAAARFRCSCEETRGKQSRGQNRCKSHRHDISFHEWSIRYRRANRTNRETGLSTRQT
jgi:hypothetical protein